MWSETKFASMFFLSIIYWTCFWYCVYTYTLFKFTFFYEENQATCWLISLTFPLLKRMSVKCWVLIGLIRFVVFIHNQGLEMRYLQAGWKWCNYQFSVSGFSPCSQCESVAAIDYYFFDMRKMWILGRNMRLTVVQHSRWCNIITLRKNSFIWRVLGRAIVWRRGLSQALMRK